MYAIVDRGLWTKDEQSLSDLNTLKALWFLMGASLPKYKLKRAAKKNFWALQSPAKSSLLWE